MPLSATRSLAVRSVIATCLASSLALVPAWRYSFSPEVLPLLPSAAVFALFCIGTSLEETAKCAFHGVLASLFSISSVYMSRVVMGPDMVPVESWLSIIVVLQATAFGVVACLLPADESAKSMFLSLTGYLLLTHFSLSMDQVWTLCTEYAAVTFFGAGCTLLAYTDIWPFLPSAYDLRGASETFEGAALGCAELIRGAAVAFLGGGAGEASLAIAHRRLEELEEQLSEARAAVEYHYWNPYVAMRRLTRSGRVAEKVLKLRREVAFNAVGEAIDTCRLLSELAAQAHSRATYVEVAVVKSVAAKRLRRVAEGAADFLEEFVGIILQQGERAPPSCGGRTIRKKLEAALRSSRNVAQELLMLTLYSGADVEEAGKGSAGMSKGVLASARSDMAAFLFIVHSLAGSLLASETRLRDAASAVARGEASAPLDTDDDLDDSDESGDDWTVSFTPALTLRKSLSLGNPLLRRRKSTRTRTRTRVASGGWRSWRRGVCFEALRQLQSFFSGAWLQGRDWQCALKVTCTFTIAFAVSVFFFDLDCTVVVTASMLCNYGALYSGSSLHRAILRGVGIAAGATAGGVAHSVAWLLSRKSKDETVGGAVWGATGMSFIVVWVFACNILYFQNGSYCYLGCVASFTAAKLITTTQLTSTSTLVMLNMYASFITAAVELGIRPVDALQVLRSRMVATLTGTAAVFSALVTTEDLPLSLQAASQYLKVSKGTSETDAVMVRCGSSMQKAAAVSSGLTPKKNSHPWGADADFALQEQLSDATAKREVDTLPDLTERLKQMGAYEQYVKWRDGFLRWRKGEAKGAHGELEAQAAAVPADDQDERKVPMSVTMTESAVKGLHAPLANFMPLTMENTKSCRAQPVSVPEASPLEDEHGSDILLSRGALATWGASDAAGTIRSEFEEGFVAAGESVNSEQGCRRVSLDAEAASEHPLLGSLAISNFATGFQRLPVGENLPGSDVSEPFAASPSKGADGKVQRDMLANREQVSLRDIRTLLSEIGNVLAPAANLASQAELRSGGSTADSHHWRSLIYSLVQVRSQLMLLSRIAHRVGHSVFVADLLGSTVGHGECAQDLANNLVCVFLQVLAVSVAAIRGKDRVSPSMVANLELQLRSSALALCAALAQRAEALGRKHSKASVPASVDEKSFVEAEVLAGAAGYSLQALLSEAGRLLAVSVALAGAWASEAPHEPQVAQDEGTAADEFSVHDLPDLTDRLQEIGAYEQYVAWREGYLRWRQGRHDGARKEVTKHTTT